ncbi:hypothetical protein [Moorella sp. E306M]|uniref:hypothetical protein n=1 Tax=Moorella sp. E306M TaxID=2572683 RepID=UPI0010FFAAED|nr:hypothetical protein [Moorella sp. E306M]GEA17765.1 hypothetical protein E306M_08990 [Moorella sp. E306M]GEA17834.1 hypothetical protein E306M_09680 [Moorella sp. E306M]
MGQSGHNTSIAKSRLGCRLPYESAAVGDGYASPGPVVTYRLDPEEIAAKYGPPVKIRERPLSRKAVIYAVEHSTSPTGAARLLKVSRKHFLAEMVRHGIAAPAIWREEETVTETIESTGIPEVQVEVQAKNLRPWKPWKKVSP